MFGETPAQVEHKDWIWRLPTFRGKIKYFCKNQAPTNGLNQILNFIDQNQMMQKYLFNTSAAGVPKMILMPTAKNNNGFFGLAFSLQRCRKKHNLRSHAAREAIFYLIPMQHGNANSNFFNTSAARTLVFVLS